MIWKFVSGINGVSTLHCNIQSLPANFEDFFLMYTEFYFSLYLIGSFKTLIGANQQLLHEVNLPGYNPISQPGIFATGGVAFYTKNIFKYAIHNKFFTSA